LLQIALVVMAGAPGAMGDNGDVVASPVAAQRSVARAGLPVVGGLFAGGLGLSVVYATTGVGLPCPFRALTGWQCPLCGGTRMGAALLHGDVAAGYALNPLAFVALMVLAVLAVVWTVEVSGGPAARLPRSVANRLRQVPAMAWALLVLLIAVVYTLLRNLG
jgi:hypothetical protein